MSNGFLVLAQNTTDLESNKIDYVSQAYLLASTLKKHNPSQNISLVTDTIVSDNVSSIFDKCIQIPGTDDAQDSKWKVENRWKLYQCSPYNETIVMDADMLVLEDISRWWSYLNKYNLFFTSNVKTYRNKVVDNNSYRKAFTENSLPNVYTGLHYFKKSDLASQFYNLLEIVCNNWQEFYSQHLPKHTPSVLSIDVAAAIVVKILDIESKVTTPNSSVTFTHMKPLIQNWITHPGSWQDAVCPYINKKGELKLGNILQRGVFHYTENSFMNTPGIENLYD